MPRRSALVALCAAVLLVAASCGKEERPTTPSRGAPSIGIAKPADGSTVPTGGVEVAADVSNFRLVNKLGDAAEVGEGHIHFYLDVSPLPTDPGKPAVTVDASTYHATGETSYTWPGLSAGTHTFGAQLVNNDHTPLQPPATATVTVTVRVPY